MRIWIDPDKAAARNLTVEEVVAALQAQNVQVAAGNTGAPPFDGAHPATSSVETLGRLTTPQQFRDIVIKRDTDGASPGWAMWRGWSSAPPTTPPTPISASSWDGKPSCSRPWRWAAAAPRIERAGNRQGVRRRWRS